VNSSGIDQQIWHQHAWRNRLQSLALLLTMAGFLTLLGWLLWGTLGLIVLLGVGLFAITLTPRLAPQLIMRLYHATPIAPQQAPELWQLLEQLSVRAGLNYVPQLYYLPSSVLNAFAVGQRQQAAIGISDGLLRSLNLRELAGVLGHELSHIRNNDLRVMGLADLLSRATSLLSLLGQLLLLLNLPLLLIGAVTINWFAIGLLIIAPIISALAQMALARNREYDADLNAARLTGDPDGLASALQRIEQIQGGWMERIFMPNRRLPGPSPLRTHPQTANRIARLMALKPSLSPREPLSIDQLYDLVARYGQPITRPPRHHIGGLWH